MAVTALKHDPNSVREQVSDTEWQSRVDLAAIYRGEAPARLDPACRPVRMASNQSQAWFFTRGIFGS